MLQHQSHYRLELNMQFGKQQDVSVRQEQSLHKFPAKRADTDHCSLWCIPYRLPLLKFSGGKFSEVQWGAVQCSVVQSSAVQCSGMLYFASTYSVPCRLHGPQGLLVRSSHHEETQTSQVRGCSHIMSAKNWGSRPPFPSLSAKNQKLAYPPSSPCQKKLEIGKPPSPLVRNHILRQSKLFGKPIFQEEISNFEIN